MATIFTLKVICGVLLRCLRLPGCSHLSPAQLTAILLCFQSSSQASWVASALASPLPSGLSGPFLAISQKLLAKALPSRQGHIS